MDKTFKKCSKCKQEKLLNCFLKCKQQKTGLYPSCKECRKAYSKTYYLQNKQEIVNKVNKWVLDNIDKKRNTALRWVKNNLAYAANNTAKYRAKQFQATPQWANLIAIKAKYQLAAMLNKNTEELWHVDHIVPLQGADVCGLHVEYNLRVIPAKENLSKGNKHGYTPS